MTDWKRITGFDWDSGNARISLDKHSVSQAEAEQLFFNEPLFVLSHEKHSDAEVRFHALGQSDHDHLLHVTFTIRQEGTRIRVISARDMSRKERNYYDQQNEI
jgi:uncharacterized protein